MSGNAWRVDPLHAGQSLRGVKVVRVVVHDMWRDDSIESFQLPAAPDLEHDPSSLLVVFDHQPISLSITRVAGDASTCGVCRSERTCWARSRTSM
jgi:hypothetical protein